MFGYIFITDDGGYVGMDHQASGGYPYITDNPLNVHLWNSIEEAVKYSEMFLNYGGLSSQHWQIKKLHGLKLEDLV